MQVIERKSGEMLVRLTKSDLLILNNALNEVCNGIDIPEFQTRIGVTQSEAAALLTSIHAELDAMDREPVKKSVAYNERRGPSRTRRSRR